MWTGYSNKVSVSYETLEDKVGRADNPRVETRERSSVVFSHFQKCGKVTAVSSYNCAHNMHTTLLSQLEKYPPPDHPNTHSQAHRKKVERKKFGGEATNGQGGVVGCGIN